MLLITPYPRLVSPLLATKSTPESSSFTRRARASSSSSTSSSSSSYPWPFLRPKRRLNGFKLKSATVPGDVESGSLVKGLKLGGMFGVWYLLNVYYNIFNKQVLLSLIAQSFQVESQVGLSSLLNLFVQPGAQGLSISSDCNSISIRLWNVDDINNVAPQTPSSPQSNSLSGKMKFSS